jgi:hypothetical protein
VTASSVCSGRSSLMAWMRFSMLDAPDVARSKERLQSLAPGALRMLERWPALQEVGEDGGLLFWKPFQYLRKVGLQRIGDAIGQPRPVLHQVAPPLDQPPQGSHVCAFRRSGIIIDKPILELLRINAALVFRSQRLDRVRSR